MVNPFDLPGLRPARRLLAVIAASALLCGGGGAALAQETIPPEDAATTTETTETTGTTTTPEPDPPATTPSPTREPIPDAADPAPPADPDPAPAEEPAEPPTEGTPAEDAPAGEPGPGEGDVPEDAVVGELAPVSEAEAQDGLQPRIRSRAARSRRAGYSPPPWLNPKPAANPQVPARCGLRIALVFDLSGSIDDEGVRESRRAGDAVVDALAGSPTEIGVYNFATKAPAIPGAVTDGAVPVADAAGVAAVKGAISRMAKAPINLDGTNWDGGLRQVPTGAYDIVYFITDGVPTTDDAGTGLDYNGSVPHASDLGHAVGQANRLKDGGTRIVPLLVGNPSRGYHLFRDDVLRADIVENDPDLEFVKDEFYFGLAKPNSWGADATGLFVARWGGLMLRKKDGLRDYVDLPEHWAINPDTRRSAGDMTRDISSPEAPVSVASYADLAENLRAQVSGPCNGRVNIIKRIVDDEGAELSRGRDWEFTATTADPVLEDGSGTAAEVRGRTDAEGAVGFRVRSDREQRVTVRETARPGYELRPRDGHNAVCTTFVGGEPVPVPVTDVGEDGFRVLLSAEGGELASVDCVVDNRKSAAAQAAKTPVAGEPVRIRPDGTADLEYTITVSNPEAAAKARGADLGDVPRLPEGVRADGDAVIEAPDTPGVVIEGLRDRIPADLIDAGRRAPIADAITLPGGAVQRFTVTLPVRVEEPATADWDRLGRCDGDASVTSRTGVPNGVRLVGDLDAGDDNACIPLAPAEEATVRITKIDADDEEAPLGGSEFALYGATPDGAIDWDDRITGGPGNGRLAEGVREGRYHLVETRAPEGYALLASPVAVDVTGHAGGYTIALADPADGALVQVGPGDPAQAEWTLTVRVADIASGTLPKTGGAGPAPYAAAAALALLAGLALAHRTRRGMG
ncbi:SpaA isopeptide-forming pilin-related protein [Corynebacterium sphenisci]|uniref:SpaA isopeptide-forming pilin-related protein n=1 Tax=Corynebacterium sphenisci TaxID=191493 RepID=UPI0026DFD800|nr:SpaA isopeptide-forming pilin-related protein [Corynebacterium sphenisci]MDO5730964.1 SpaA isopeptide-forming pilin-related protein [Corynebacterium sphenisci]